MKSLKEVYGFKAKRLNSINLRKIILEEVSALKEEEEQGKADQENKDKQIEMELDEEEPSEEEPSEQELETGTTPGHASHLNTCSARTESKDGNAGGQAECQS